MKHLQLLFLFSVTLLAGCGSGESAGDPDDGAANRGTSLRSVISQTRFSDAKLETCILQQAKTEGWIYLEELTSLFCEPALSSLEGLQVLTHLKDIDLIVPALAPADIDVLLSLPLAVFDQMPEYRFNSGLKEDAIPVIHKPLNRRFPLVKAGDSITKVAVIVDHDSHENIRDPESVWRHFDGFDRSRNINIGARKVNDQVSLHWANGYINSDPTTGGQRQVAELVLERRYTETGRHLVEEPAPRVDVYQFPAEIVLQELQEVNAALLNCIQRLAFERGWNTNWEVTEILCPAENITSVSGIAAFPFVERINISNNLVSSFQALGELPYLTYLDVSHNRLSRALYKENLDIVQTGNTFTLPWGKNWHVYQSGDQWWVDVPDSQPPAHYSLGGSHTYNVFGDAEKYTVLETLASDKVLDNNIFYGDPVFLSMSGDIEQGVVLPRYLVGESVTGISCLPAMSDCMSLDGNRLLVKRQVGYAEDAWQLVTLDGPTQELVRVSYTDSKRPMANDADTVIFLDEDRKLYSLSLIHPGFFELGLLPAGVQRFHRAYLSGNDLWGIGAVINNNLTKRVYRFNRQTRQWSRLPGLNLHPLREHVAELDGAEGGVRIASSDGPGRWVESWNQEFNQWQWQSASEFHGWGGELTLADGYRYRYSDYGSFRLISPSEMDFEYVRLPLEIHLDEFDDWVPLTVPAFDHQYFGASFIELSDQVIVLRSRHYTQRYDPALDPHHPYRARLKLDWFPDENLRQCLVDHFGAEPDIAINEIRSLNCNGYGITSDLGLERLVFLEELSLSENNLQYVGGSPFATIIFMGSPQGLLALQGLKTLNLSYNRLTRIAYLKSLKHLETLDLTANEFTEAPQFPDSLQVLLTDNPIQPDPVQYTLEKVDQQWVVDIGNYDPALTYGFYRSDTRMREYSRGLITDQERQPVFPVLFVNSARFAVPESLLADINWIAVQAQNSSGGGSDVLEFQRLLDTRGYWRDLGYPVSLDQGGVTPFGWFEHGRRWYNWRFSSELDSAPTEIRRPSNLESQQFSIWENTIFVAGENSVVRYEVGEERLDFLPPLPSDASDGQILATALGPFYVERPDDGDMPGLLFWQESEGIWQVLDRFNEQEGGHLMLSADSDGVALGMLSQEGDFALYACGLMGCATEPRFAIQLPQESFRHGSDIEMQLHQGSAYLLSPSAIIRINLETGEFGRELTSLAGYGRSLTYVGYTGNSFIYKGDWQCDDEDCKDRLFEYLPE